MSEYQYIEFRAVDRPLDDKQFAFAERQSSRAEVNRWSMTNEYHYGEFRGDVDGLLRRGYDVHLMYTNYGEREVKFRLPAGLPFSKQVRRQYIDGERLNWKKDSKGSAGILTLLPFHESDSIEEAWEFSEFVDACVEVRRLLLEGDLRALYLLWLCAADDDNIDPNNISEPPVPVGLSKLPVACDRFLNFYGLDPLLFAAASEGTGACPAQRSCDERITSWVDELNHARAKELLCRFLVEDVAHVKAETMTEIRDSHETVDWPTVELGGSLETLHMRTHELREQENVKKTKREAAKAKREAAKAELVRQERMKEMIKKPQHWLEQADALADARGIDNYKAAAEILADLREAVGGDEGETITRRHASHLANKHPTLSRLKSSLRKRGLLD